MLDGEETLRFCLRNQITIEQFFILYLLSRQDFNRPEKQSLGIQYIRQFGTFTDTAITGLLRKGFVEDMNSPGEFYPQYLILTPKARQQFADMDMADELWNTYPLTFPLNDKGTKFIARAGGDKDELLQLYLQKLNHSTPKHQFAIHHLKRYKDMVVRGEVNGYKIGDWIRQEMWDTIAQIGDDQKGGDFGKDI